MFYPTLEVATELMQGVLETYRLKTLSKEGRQHIHANATAKFSNVCGCSCVK